MNNLHNNEASRFFDRFAVTFDSFYDGKRNKIMQKIDQIFRKDIFIRFALTFQNIEDIQNRTILDVGCGSGVYMFEALKKKAKFVCGVDPAEGMLNLAKKRLSSEIDFEGRFNLILGNFPDVDVDFYDYAIVMGVMDYVDDPVAFLRKLKKKIKVAVLISFPSTHWIRTPIRKLRYKLRSCPLYFYDESKIRELAHLSGYTKIIVTQIDGAGLDYHVRLECD